MPIALSRITLSADADSLFDPELLVFEGQSRNKVSCADDEFFDGLINQFSPKQGPAKQTLVNEQDLYIIFCDSEKEPEMQS